MDHLARVGAGVYLVLLLAAVVAFKAVFADIVLVDPVFGVYGLVVCAYIVSRFVFSTLYRPSEDHGLRPRVAIVMPAFNEEEAIAASLTSLLDLDYAPELLEIVAVNDGSTDDTLPRMQAVAAGAGGRVRVIDLGRNRGKRAAMAAGIRATDAQIIAFVDSDSVLEPDAMTKLVQGFHDPRRRGDLRARRRPEPPRHVADEDAGRPLLRRVQGQQGRGVAVQRGDVLLGLLLGLPPRGGDAAPGVVGDADVPGRRVDVRRRPLADELRAARLEGPLRVAGGLAHDRAGRPSASS